MDRIQEIQARLAAINNEIDNATGDALTALETESRSLLAELSTLQQTAQARQQLRQQIAQGAGNPVAARAAAPAAAPATETVEQQELRSFAGFIRGTVSQMRAGEQNFTMGNNAALIPQTIAKRVIDAVTDRCPILAGAEIYHVKGTFKIPVYGKSNSTHDITVGYSAEFSELTADAGAFTSIDLTGYLAGALTLIGRSVANNSDIDLVGFVVSKMADKIAGFIENELLNGTGSSNNHCTGALSVANTMNAGSTTAISADNLIDLQSKVKQAFQAGAVWTMHPNTWTAIKKLKDNNQRPLVSEDFSAAFPYRLLGKPVHLSDAMPTIASAAKAVLYGDYSGLGVNIREDISVEILREKYATQHAIGVVAWLEIDSKIVNEQKLATLTMSAVSGG